MLEKSAPLLAEGYRALMNEFFRADELTVMNELIAFATVPKEQTRAIEDFALDLIGLIRQKRKKAGGTDSFLIEYPLSGDEGIALMCLAEALLRVPDNATIDSLVKDKLTMANWSAHLGNSDSSLVNATTWALRLAGKVLTPERADSLLGKAVFKLVNPGGKRLIRKAVEKAMRIMSKQFVMGRTIDEAMIAARKKESRGYRYSYDMLGEAALTKIDAKRYFTAYWNAIERIGATSAHKATVGQRAGISIKLSALHPRYQEAQRVCVLDELTPILLNLARHAKDHNIALTVDAEESERLDLSLDVIERVFNDDSLDGWNGFGMAVQSYQKRAFYLLDWVACLARAKKRRMMVRLVKGAYWDSEIKKAQMQGLSGYPVFTRKAFTDVSYQACVKKMLDMRDAIYPQFATHNAYTVAMILTLAGDYRDFEFQCLHGMGTELYEQIVPPTCFGIPCRIYAPVGSHEDLLPYLVRRLLENGANSSFVNRIADDSIPPSILTENPVDKALELLNLINQNIPLPSDLFLPERKNSTGFDFNNRREAARLVQTCSDMEGTFWQSRPLLAGKKDDPALSATGYKRVSAPQNPEKLIGQVIDATGEDLEWALVEAHRYVSQWRAIPVEERAVCLEKLAVLLEENQAQLVTLLCLEAGKTLNDGIAEVREATDFCRYYAARAIILMAKPQRFCGYTGELNEMSLQARGVVLCISPWNFPLAIFIGQIVAAAVTGNCVIAKPAAQTPLIAAFAVRLMHKAGMPPAVVQLLPGEGSVVGAPLVADRRIKAVLFTGSSQTATVINRTLANREGEIIPFIAETGGQNAMIVDSSALLEQVAIDVMSSAFASAGQRCSALRVLYVQKEVYPRLMELLKGAMAELVIGDPQSLTTDVGPVIDRNALALLQQHVETMRQRHDIIFQCQLPENCRTGYFMPPVAIAIDSMAALEQEIFGPVLHVVCYHQKNLDNIIEDINNTGYGLTLGIHSRINHRIDYIRQRIHAGNCYVNRNMIGAVPGLQPFGGQGLSGTGPKAGGPNYLLRLCHEQTYTADTTSAGGNASLMSL